MTNGSKSQTEDSVPQPEESVNAHSTLYAFASLLGMIRRMAYVVDHKKSVKAAKEGSFLWYAAVLTEIGEMLDDRTQVP